jgi:glucose dehydrogenase
VRAPRHLRRPSGRRRTLSRLDRLRRRPDSIRYSALDQINRGNVARLEVAWTYDTGDAFPDSEMECNPIVVNGLLYATTPKLRLIALDAATGKLRWSFDPRQNERAFGKARNRGVTYWADGADQRIFFVASHWLYALDARTGAIVKNALVKTAAWICGRAWAGRRKKCPFRRPAPASSTKTC